MSVTVNAASADIDLMTGQAKADVTVGRRIAVFHLTQGFSLPQVEDQGLMPGPALSALGHFRVTVAGPGGLAGWGFGFVQLAKTHAGAAFYAGRIRQEGSIAVMFSNALPSALLLDSLSDRHPWNHAAPQFELDGTEVTCPMADHPSLKVPRELRNSGRNVNNFLFHVIDDREFWSVLTAVDPTGKRQHLAHFRWRVSHDVQFGWQGGNPVVTRKRCVFKVEGKGKGAPPEPELQALLAAPAPPHFNAAAGEAMLKAFTGARGPNRTENDVWFMNVPPTFFS